MGVHATDSTADSVPLTCHLDLRSHGVIWCIYSILTYWCYMGKTHWNDYNQLYSGRCKYISFTVMLLSAALSLPTEKTAFDKKKSCLSLSGFTAFGYRVDGEKCHHILYQNPHDRVKDITNASQWTYILYVCTSYRTKILIKDTMIHDVTRINQKCNEVSSLVIKLCPVETTRGLEKELKSYRSVMGRSNSFVNFFKLLIFTAKLILDKMEQNKREHQ